MAHKKKSGKKKKSKKRMHGTGSTVKRAGSSATRIVASGLGQIAAASLLNFGTPMLPAGAQKFAPLPVPVIGVGIDMLNNAPPGGNFVQHMTSGFGGYGIKASVANFLPGVRGIMEPDMNGIEQDIKNRMGSITIGDVQVGDNITVGGQDSDMNGAEAETYG